MINVEAKRLRLESNSEEDLVPASAVEELRRWCIGTGNSVGHLRILARFSESQQYQALSTAVGFSRLCFSDARMPKFVALIMAADHTSDRDPDLPRPGEDPDQGWATDGLSQLLQSASPSSAKHALDHFHDFIIGTRMERDLIQRATQNNSSIYELQSDPSETLGTFIEIHRRTIAAEQSLAMFFALSGIDIDDIRGLRQAMRLSALHCMWVNDIGSVSKDIPTNRHPGHPNTALASLLLHSGPSAAEAMNPTPANQKAWETTKASLQQTVVDLGNDLCNCLSRLDYVAHPQVTSAIVKMTNGNLIATRQLTSRYRAKGLPPSPLLDLLDLIPLL